MSRLQNGWRAPAFAGHAVLLLDLRARPAGDPGLVCLYFLGTTRGFFVGGLAALIGYMLPGFWLARQTEKRKKLIANGLPDAWTC